jgi:hypothetical protein
MRLDLNRFATVRIRCDRLQSLRCPDRRIGQGGIGLQITWRFATPSASRRRPQCGGHQQRMASKSHMAFNQRQLVRRKTLRTVRASCGLDLTMLPLQEELDFVNTNF